MNPPVPPDVARQIRDLLFEGRKIEAIRIYRLSTDCSLAAAKQIVEGVEHELRAKEPGSFKQRPAGNGCFIAVAIVAAILFAAMLLR